MKRYLLSLVLICSVMTTSAQRISTQQFMVRKITFSAQDPIVPISGIFVEINNVKFRSDTEGAFVANIPISNDLGFNISNVHAPGYILSVPEDLSKRVYLSSNPIVIVLADIEAVKNERERILANNRREISKYEAKIKVEVEKTANLLSQLKSKDEEYTRVLNELEAAQKQLKAFQENRSVFEAKADSLVTNLLFVDIQSLPVADQQRIENEKSGKWVDALAKEMLENLNKKIESVISDKISKFKNTIDSIAADYENKYIKGNTNAAITYFSHAYINYIEDAISKSNNSQNAEGLDKVVSHVINDELRTIFYEHISSCQKRWESLIKETTNRAEGYQYSYKSQADAKRDFILWAMYPERSKLQTQIKGRYLGYRSEDEGIRKTFERVYPKYMQACRNVVSRFDDKYSQYSLEQLYSMSQEDLDTIVSYDDFLSINRASDIFWSFKHTMQDIATNALKVKIAKRVNEAIDKQRQEVLNAKLEPIYKQIKPISGEAKFSTQLNWEHNKHAKQELEEYQKLKKEYPDYFSFLEPIVIMFLQPIIDKYNSDEALYVVDSAMNNDVHKYCWTPFHLNQNRLSYIENMPGSDNECMSIVKAIISNEKAKMIQSHNRRVDEINGYK